MTLKKITSSFHLLTFSAASGQHTHDTYVHTKMKKLMLLRSRGFLSAASYGGPGFCLSKLMYDCRVIMAKAADCWILWEGLCGFLLFCFLYFTYGGLFGFQNKFQACFSYSLEVYWKEYLTFGFFEMCFFSCWCLKSYYNFIFIP